jgi:predicted membrane-bound spermidine synthase
MEDSKELGGGASLYLSVGLLSGAVIALQITIMRIFSVGNWAHFGSFIVSVAMLGIGIASTLMCINQPWVEQRWRGVSSASLIAFGPIAVVSNLLAQQVPFNAIFLIADSSQKWRLALNFVLYLTPFVAASLFLGGVFLKARGTFARVYFADLVGCGLCSLVLLLGMYVFHADDLIIVPLVLWAVATVFWARVLRSWPVFVALLVAAAFSFCGHLVFTQVFDIKKVFVSDYKGVSYARHFPDAARVYERATPFGQIEVYSSSYLHFAPGLSDNAAIDLTNFPDNAYLGLYVDGDGPVGVLRHLPDEQTKYFDYLPTSFAYLTKPRPDVFIVEFAGGLSTVAALRKNATSVTVADSNPAVLNAFKNDDALRKMTGDVLHRPGVQTVDMDGRVFLSTTTNRYDLVDLSLADSAGLSSPGGFAIVEKYDYTREAMLMYMRALKDGGVLSITLWNKEDPPKSALRLYATMYAAAQELGEAKPEDCFFSMGSYLGTTTVLFQRGGFSLAEIGALQKRTTALSFEEIYAPGAKYDISSQSQTLEAYRAQIFGAINPGKDNLDNTDSPDGTGPTTMPAISVARMVWQALIANNWQSFADAYVYDIHPLSNDRPYFAAYLRPHDLPLVVDRIDLLQDEWGYLLVWATLFIAIILGALLVILPALFGWRRLMQPCPGKAGTLLYFACLGLGYIMVEVALISHFTLALSHSTISATVLISGMLAFSGLGSLASQRVLDNPWRAMPWIFGIIAVLLVGYGFWLDHVLDWVAGFPYQLRLPACLLLILPPAFFMGMPMPVGMTMISRLGKDQLFLWAWGVNGCMSVIGAALVPVIATSYGLNLPLTVAGGLYLVAMLGLRALLKPVEVYASDSPPIGAPVPQEH